jgi:hypothetical protein
MRAIKLLISSNGNKVSLNDIIFHFNEYFFTRIIEYIHDFMPICTESFRPGLSLKPGLNPENGFKSYAHQKT